MALEKLLPSKVVAEQLGISENHLSTMRVRGGGPRYTKIGYRSVRYDPADVQAWLEERKTNSTSEVRAA